MSEQCEKGVWDHGWLVGLWEGRDESKARIAALEAQLAEKERVNAALLLKYHRVRENVRNISRTLRDRRANDYRKRYSALMHVCEQLAFAAGKMVQKTDDFTWIRMTKPDYDQYREWLAASRESKEASAPTNGHAL